MEKINQKNRKNLDIIEWSKKKIEINNSNKYPRFFKEREIWWASIGSNVGSEEDGKNNDFERPVLILKKFNKDLIITIPLTSKIKESVFYYDLKTPNFGSVILSQLRVFSSKRLRRKIIRINKLEYLEILKLIIRCLG
ncbi:type II toxin-antitoxin system PemK/MazF family toxin [Candidatus Falkowbacteria bacterium]|nr:type II toxin-antitoxin system PemK/MazF family toxin [Candidatus Falkowbacteria bacterium]